MSRLNRKKRWLTRSLSTRATKVNPEKCNCEGFLGQKEAGALLPREKSVITLYVGIQEALAL